MTSKNLEMTTERQRCKATRTDGQPCRAWAIRDGLCVGHSPESEEARRKGGFNSSKKARAEKLLPLRLRPLLEELEKALQEVHEGKLDYRQGGAMASLANAITKVYESGVMEERLTELEARIGGNHHGGYGTCRQTVAMLASADDIFTSKNRGLLDR